MKSNQEIHSVLDMEGNLSRDILPSDESTSGNVSESGVEVFLVLHDVGMAPALGAKDLVDGVPVFVPGECSSFVGVSISEESGGLSKSDLLMVSPPVLSEEGVGIHGLDHLIMMMSSSPGNDNGKEGSKFEHSFNKLLNVY